MSLSMEENLYGKKSFESFHKWTEKAKLGRISTNYFDEIKGSKWKFYSNQILNIITSLI